MDTVIWGTAVSGMEELILPGNQVNYFKRQEMEKAQQQACGLSGTQNGLHIVIVLILFCSSCFKHDAAVITSAPQEQEQKQQRQPNVSLCEGHNS